LIIQNGRRRSSHPKAGGGISLISLPYATVTALSFGTIGWGGVVALAFTGIVANWIARKLALTRSKTNDLLQRLASLTNIGKTISLRYTTDELLMAIYTECRTAIDCSLFSIALLNEATNELAFELDVRDGQILSKERIPLGEGLNSWVVQHHQPLLLGSTAEERRFGVKAVEDTKATESWLGVPMIIGDFVTGIISLQNLDEENAFSEPDVRLLSIAFLVPSEHGKNIRLGIGVSHFATLIFRTFSARSTSAALSATILRSAKRLRSRAQVLRTSVE